MSCFGECSGAPVVDNRLGLGLTVERRLAERSWLMFLATAGYRKSGQSGGSYESEDTNLHASGSVGPRFVLTSDLPVEVALYGVLSAAYSSSERSSRGAPDTLARIETPGSQRHSKSLGARFGLTFDRALAEGLGVRLGLNLVGFDWTQSAEDVSGNETDGLSLGLRPEATLLLTMSF